jgi:hypothetical protein
MLRMFADAICGARAIGDRGQRRMAGNRHGVAA